MPLKKLLLNLYFWPVFAFITVMGIPLVLPPVLLIGVINRSTGRLLRHVIRFYGWVLVRIVPFMAPVTLEDRTGGVKLPAIFIANHCSSVDPYLFGMIPYEMAFVTSWPFNIPVYNRIMRLADYIDSNLGWENIQKQSAELLRQGCSLIIWPEGHRSKDGRLTRFRNGAFRLACLNKVPIVPVCIIGTHKIMQPGRRLLTPARIRVILLPPLPPQGDPDSSEDIKAYKKQARLAITEELRQHGLLPGQNKSPHAPAMPSCPANSTSLQSHG